MRFLEFVGHKQFRRVDCGILGYKLLVARNIRHPWCAGCVLVVEYQFVCGKTEGLRAAKRRHCGDEFLVHDPNLE